MSPFGKIAKLVRLRFGLPFARRADRAREAGEWVDAVVDYRRGLEWMPWRDDLKVQIGNCLKEFGDYHGAIRAYAAVTAGTSLPEARKQAEDASRRAGTVLLPFAIAEGPDALGPARARADVPAPSDRLLPNRIRLDATEPRGWLGPLGKDTHVSSRRRGAGYAAIKLDQVGAMVLERDGAQEPLLAGVVAIRGRVSVMGSLDEVSIELGRDGVPPVCVRAPLRLVPGHQALRLYVFNIWIDAATLPHGRHWLSVGVGGRIAPAGLFVNVAEPVDGDHFAGSNSFLAAPLHAPGSLDAAVTALPALVRPAARTLFDRPVATILAMRVDQLGDVSASLPALMRLRALFPTARLIVLAQSGTQAVIEACGLADEVLSITLTYDPVSERRRLDPAEEQRVRAMLVDRNLDLAIDLSPGDESRPLLLLTGATYLVGFNPDRFTWLDFGISTRSRDKVNQLEKLSHAASVSMLVEALAIAAAPARAVVPVTPAPDAIRAQGLEPGSYVVLHLGARHAINRWPVEHFVALCRRVLGETPHRVVIFADQDAGALADMADERVRVFGLVAPTLFDTLLSGARAMVGNDSGPKHLAAVRGVPTVSVHVDRLNWNEWGQDGIGAIVSKRMPCTGCGLNDIALCGRDAVCVRAITVDEVWEALVHYL
ncbi:ADP-heptose:LPS heptosyltransferase [Sphingomonas gellani]|uniref:ADP-heptose:LPS heptosyltransferase n=1 Tax=Sphingomonas gellani TaxID=1166340 RepID=A0A1H8I853_9SPHN|nr:glycosyltransferase family 9 protein [Sphingomonas gellani]SEN64345.1 ADP-heptose:LPS heptosyltransferase [Sphingomonas gellani]